MAPRPDAALEAQARDVLLRLETAVAEAGEVRDPRRIALGLALVVLGAVAFTLLKELFQSEALLGPIAGHWQLTLGLYGVIAAATFATVFLTTRERIAPPAQQNSAVLQDLKDLLNNRAWVVLFALALVSILGRTGG